MRREFNKYNPQINYESEIVQKMEAIKVIISTTSLYIMNLHIENTYSSYNTQRNISSEYFLIKNTINYEIKIRNKLYSFVWLPLIIEIIAFC